MERLTKKIGNTNCVKGCGSNCKYGFQHCRTEDWENCKTIDDVIDKLAEYEDLEEQGRLIKIPLEAYCIVDFEVRKGFVLEETYHMSRKPLLVVRYDDNSLKSHSGYLGISVFLTKSEAEAKLKELRGEENDG